MRSPLAGGSGGSFGACHSAKDASTGLDLETSRPGERLSGKASLTCDGALIEPGNPDASVLYTKLFDPPPCGARMPLTYPELSATDKEAIGNWIRGLGGTCATGGAGGATTTTTSGGSGGATLTGGAPFGGTAGTGGM